jgi:hypothetical protein
MDRLMFFTGAFAIFLITCDIAMILIYRGCPIEDGEHIFEWTRTCYNGETIVDGLTIDQLLWITIGVSIRYLVLSTLIFFFLLHLVKDEIQKSTTGQFEKTFMFSTLCIGLYTSVTFFSVLLVTTIGMFLI